MNFSGNMKYKWRSEYDNFFGRSSKQQVLTCPLSRLIGCCKRGIRPSRLFVVNREGVTNGLISMICRCNNVFPTLLNDFEPSQRSPVFPSLMVDPKYPFSYNGMFAVCHIQPSTLKWYSGVSVQQLREYTDHTLYNNTGLSQKRTERCGLTPQEGRPRVLLESFYLFLVCVYQCAHSLKWISVLFLSMSCTHASRCPLMTSVWTPSLYCVVIITWWENSRRCPKWRTCEHTHNCTF